MYFISFITWVGTEG